MSVLHAVRDEHRLHEFARHRRVEELARLRLVAELDDALLLVERDVRQGAHADLDRRGCCPSARAPRCPRPASGSWRASSRRVSLVVTLPVFSAFAGVFFLAAIVRFLETSESCFGACFLRGRLRRRFGGRLAGLRRAPSSAWPPRRAARRRRRRVRRRGRHRAAAVGGGSSPGASLGDVDEARERLVEALVDASPWRMPRISPWPRPPRGCSAGRGRGACLALRALARARRWMPSLRPHSCSASFISLRRSS